MDTATIAEGETLSGAVNLGKHREYILVQTPEVLTSCALSLYASLDGVTYYPLGHKPNYRYDNGQLNNQL